MDSLRLPVNDSPLSVLIQKKAKTSCSPPEKSPAQPKLSPGAKRPREPSKGGAGPEGKRQRRGAAEKEKTGAGGRPKNSQRRSVASKVSYKEHSSEGEISCEEEEYRPIGEEESEDSGEEAPARPGRKGRGKGAAPQRRRSKKEASSEGEEEEEGDEVGRSQWRKGGGVDEWLEVYLERAGRWVCLAVQQTGVGQYQQCTREATQPMSYVLAVDGNGYLKDLSARYDPTWLTSTRKRRVEPEWWEETLSGFRCPASQRERQEDREVRRTHNTKSFTQHPCILTYSLDSLMHASEHLSMNACTHTLKISLTRVHSYSLTQSLHVERIYYNPYTCI